VPGAPSWALDTNVVVSGLLSPIGPSGRLIDMLLAGQLRLTLDDRVEAEYREVLSRPKFRIPDVRMEAFLAVLQFQDSVSAAPWSQRRPVDSDDTKFLEVAWYATDRILVTGNQKHFPKACRGGVKILTPRLAWEKFSKDRARA